MAVQPYSDINAHARSIRELATRNPQTLTGSEQYNLQALAVMCGYHQERVQNVRPADLLEVLKAAQYGPEKAVALTARIARANGVPVEADRAPKLPDALPHGDYVTHPDLEAAKAELREYADDRGGQAAQVTQERLDAFADSLPSLVEVAVAEAVAKRTATELVVTMPGLAPLPVGLVHYQTPRIIRALANGLNVYLHGPAGSGKTTVGKKAAEAFGLPFYTTAKVESEYLLLGFRNAQGETVRTPFRDAYENGGVFLFDEMDASSPGAIVALNMALANGVCPFPDGLVQRHKDFHCIGAGNTTLGGATRQYAGRNQLDAASVDRFYFIDFPYDEALEMELATNKLWCAHVQAIRAAVKERGLTHLVTPRASFDGSKALAMGDTWEEAQMACLFKGLDKETVDVLRRAVPQPRIPDPILG